MYSSRNNYRNDIQCCKDPTDVLSRGSVLPASAPLSLDSDEEFSTRIGDEILDEMNLL